MNDTATTNFVFVPHWPKGTPENGEAVLAFWQHENAIANIEQAKKRLAEVVMHAVTEDGEVAGVCTAVPITLPRLGQPTYYYRCFVGAKWRQSRLVLSLLQQAGQVLEAFAREHDFPCIGIVLELENARFGQTLQTALWRPRGAEYVFIGKSQRGLDLRVKYFQGAKLKLPKI